MKDVIRVLQDATDSLKDARMLIDLKNIDNNAGYIARLDKVISDVETIAGLAEIQQKITENPELGNKKL